MDYKQLALAALKAREGAYTPYSGFKVGAALLCEDGSIYSGCNIENAAYTPTVCAERVAFFKAVSDGKRAFKAIAIVGGRDKAGVAYPCGVCRQVMAEFCDACFEILLVEDSSGAYRQTTLSQLLPHSFGKGDL